MVFDGCGSNAHSFEGIHILKIFLHSRCAYGCFPDALTVLFIRRLVRLVRVSHMQSANLPGSVSGLAQTAIRYLDR